MLKWLIYRGKEGGIGGFFAGVLLVLIVFFEMLVGFFLGVYICMAIEELLGKGQIATASIPIILLPCILAPFFRYYFISQKVKGGRKPYEARSISKTERDKGHTAGLSSSELRVVLGRDKIPFYNDLLDKKQVKYLLKGIKFNNYKYRSGEESDYIQISDDEKWINIGGSILPLDFICGYNKHSNVMYAIDSATLVLPKEAGKPNISDQIEKFFEDRGGYYKSLPPIGRYSLRGILEKNKTELKKADWGRIRYLWEKECANSYRGKQRRFKTNTTIFERVLSTKELLSIIKIVENTPQRINDYLVFSKYKNEYCVCDCVEILRRLKYPENSEGLDFLFECLRDVDEAYFLYAINVLKMFPKDMLEEKIEENAKAAYESGNVQKLAGVMYLAKEVGYDIEFVRQLKGEPNLENIPGVTVTEAENAVKKFEVNEDVFYGSGEALGFDPDDLSYSDELQEFGNGGVAYAVKDEERAK